MSLVELALVIILLIFVFRGGVRSAHPLWMPSKRIAREESHPAGAFRNSDSPADRVSGEAPAAPWELRRRRTTAERDCADKHSGTKLSSLMKPLRDHCLVIRLGSLVIGGTFGLVGCSVLSPSHPQPSHYFWDANPQTKEVHAAVACKSLETLLTFNRLYLSGTAKDEREEATLLGESSVYASDTPPDAACQRAGRSEGAVKTPGPTDRVKNINESSDGTMSFEWDFASAVAESPRQTRTFYTYPEYLISRDATTDPAAKVVR